ncbi:hypothetical protein [Marinomonas primoryensis]|uniref:Uncharacterized protein n=1 Tax=Marinomonas primoryensis TaxID=178399 RepID=A0A859CW75_9GAMM|nr:hypothetical protein [Marinomonas primoryensis]QKK80794.1 uncharacterized protein MP3633_2067 [Marinomonas primoryensis]
MSGSLPHTIALSSHTSTSTTTPGYTTFDLRSDEDTSLAALNTRNAKASSDLVVTISEQGQALSQRKQKKFEEETINKKSDIWHDLEEEFIEDDLEPLIDGMNKETKTTSYKEKTPTGDVLDQIV